MIPSWNTDGVIPPIRPGTSPAGRDRSPYIVTFSAFLRHFGKTAHRVDLMSCLLEYRSLLYNAGIRSGFQWINGSFTEHVELIDSREPNDIDCVTFFELPKDVSQQQLYEENKNIFEHLKIKNTLHIDSYFVHLGRHSRTIVANSAYWVNLFGHRRDGVWKGFIEIALSPDEDRIAKDVLTHLHDEVANG